MKKFLKNVLLRNRWSDFEIILQESGFDISGRPDCPIRAIAITGQAAFTICEPAGQVNFWSIIVNLGLYRRYWYLKDLISKWILNCLQNSFKKSDPSKNMAVMEDSFSSYGVK